ncbi:MAG TPA: LLM class flavin-dependent oxidoreductase [Acidimicrobiales bacterium]|nr:LLM class flavin-dependent oxidoreductase [Acidimicrobiales bacterium]
MRIGITLPHFRDDADAAIDAAREAEAQGLDGVFCFDHLWPMGQPGRPAISSAPLLGAVAVSTSTIAIGTLVARVGLVPDDVLASELSTLHTLSGGRLIAGIGTGDHLSRPENEAFGVPFERAAERRIRLATVAAGARDAGIPVWVGGGLPKTIELARSLMVAVNLWDGEDIRVAELVASGIEVTWGGPVGGSADQVTARLAEVAEAGATWAVCAWPRDLGAVAAAAAVVGGASPRG